MAMRVTNSALYRKYTYSVNEVHSKYNKTMNKISSGAAYEAAADNPLAYYSGKRLDNQYQDTLTKQELITDIQKRLYQQELGARSIQGDLCSGEDSVNTKMLYILNGTNNEIPTTVGSIRDHLIQKQQSMVDALNTEYENFYVFGGNDLSTTPFSISFNDQTNEMVLTYKHKFAGDKELTEFNFSLQEENGSYTFKLQGTGSEKKLMQAMKEQGRVDIGYGTIDNKDTLIDTYSGGLNLLTGITSDSVKSMGTSLKLEEIEKALADSAIGVTGQAIVTMNKYMTYLENGKTGPTTDPNEIDKSGFQSKLSDLISEIDTASGKLGAVYGSLGNKYSLLETTHDRLDEKKISLEDQYRDKLGADFYESIMEMFSYQQSYTASLQVSSNIMRTSLFDFMR